MSTDASRATRSTRAARLCCPGRPTELTFSCLSPGGARSTKRGFFLLVPTHAAQAARVALETWASFSLYCLNCEREALDQLPDNTPVADFECMNCASRYQLKGKNGRMGKRVVRAVPDGAVATLSWKASTECASSRRPGLTAVTYATHGARSRMRRVKT